MFAWKRERARALQYKRKQARLTQERDENTREPSLGTAAAHAAGAAGVAAGACAVVRRPAALIVHAPAVLVSVAPRQPFRIIQHAALVARLERLPDLTVGDRKTRDHCVLRR